MHDLITVMSNILKLLTALFCGGLIGWRNRINKKRVVMTPHILLAGSSCLIMIISTNRILWEPAQTAGYAALGLGLIGAGVIIGEKGSMAGIWSAVSLWISGVSGLAIGTGLFLEGAAIALISYFVLAFLNN